MRINNVPNGWTKKRLSKIALLQRGRFSIRPRNDPSCYGGDVPFVQTGDVSKAGIYLKHFSQTLNEKGVAVSKVFPANTILITIAANIGDTAITTFPVACPDSLIAINSEHYNFMWLNYVLQTQKNKLNALATQNAQKNINLETLNNLKLLVPPIGEQKKIAEILGTWDRAIEELTDLIAEKKELRKGLANRLLNVLTWNDIELSDLLDYEQPTKYLVTKILDYDAQKIPVLTANKAFVLGSTDDTTGVYSKQDCIIFDDFTTDMKYVNFKFKVKSSAIKILTPRENVNLKFVFEQMQRLKLPIGGHKRYWLSEYQYLTIKIPDDDTQSKIVSILSKADSEIDLLNQRLDILKEQKRGLMQKLLTGEIRVKVDVE